MAFAKRLLSKRSVPEEESRSAISRAYYSLFHETDAKLKRKYTFDLIKNLKKGRRLTRRQTTLLNKLDPTLLRTFNMHRVFTDTLIDLGFKAYGISMKQFRDKRNQADYDLNLNISHSDATFTVNSIDRLISQIQSI